MRTLAIAIALGALGGCAYPTSSISQGSEPGHLRFVGPVGAGIRVDGRDRGVIAAKGPTMVDVDQARHVVEEVADGRVILHREYEIGAGSTVEIRGGN